MPRLIEISSEKPFYLQAQPDAGATPRNCWLNVPHYIKKHGGEPFSGFHVILHYAQYYAIVVPHVVVKTQDGFRDVTPPEQEDKVLFLPKQGVTIESNGYFLKLSKKRKAKLIIDVAWKTFTDSMRLRQKTT